MNSYPREKIPYAHEKAIHAVEYHPLGHLLCTAGSDKTARFWSRARPNDPMAWKDAVYTDCKAGAWYYSVNNNVNAVMEDPNAVKNEDDEIANNDDPLSNSGRRRGVGASASGGATGSVPGLRSRNETPNNGSYAIPGLRGF
ncbi:WD domain, G-beta repeat family protein [Candida albicans]|uniref:Polyadenylation factor subunit 2 n=1 Tax=Candida albicans TaxID=5476 RepID=A0A8H6BR50_CANAX|nr:WD domain, G-beta repeat family protein [Candida albicans]